MPTYTVTSPSGKRYRVTAPEGVSQDEVMRRVQQQHGEDPSQLATGAAGLAVGGMSMARGGREIIEKTTGMKNAPERAWSAILRSMYGIDIPAERLRSWEDELQKYANKTGTGRAAQVVGSILPMLVPVLGEVEAGAAGVTTLGKALAPAVGDVRLASAVGRSPFQRLMASAGARRAGEGAVVSGLQPVDSDKDFAAKKAAQVGLGAVAGGVPGSQAGQRSLAWLASHVPIHGAAGMLGYHLSPAALAWSLLFPRRWTPWGRLSDLAHAVQERYTDPFAKAAGGSAALRKGAAATAGQTPRVVGEDEEDGDGEGGTARSQ